MSVHCTQLRICGAELASRDHECEYPHHVVEPVAPGARAPDSSIHRIDKLRIDRGDWVRVGGDIECTVCGFVYYDHPSIAGARWLKRACDGRLIKT